MITGVQKSMNNLQKQAALNKLAQMRLAINYVARQRAMQKYAAKEPADPALVEKLQEQANRSLLWDLASKVGWRGLQGLGIGAGVGAIGGGTLGAVGGGLLGAGAAASTGRSVGYGAAGGALGMGALGALGGAANLGYYGTGIGALAGGIESLLTYEDRKKRARNRLKELGVKDNVLDD